jgi:hypothetical protein
MHPGSKVHFRGRKEGRKKEQKKERKKERKKEKKKEREERDSGASKETKVQRKRRL